jgi:hypothetical protein
VASVCSGLVVATSFPFGELVHQHDEIAAASRRLHALEAQNRALRLEAAALASPAERAALARADFGLAPPGATEFDVLPQPGSVPLGRVPLDSPPVLPGSARSERLLTGLAPVSLGDRRAGGAPRGLADRRDARGAAAPSRPSFGTRSDEHGGFLARVLRSLEFWR